MCTNKQKDAINSNLVGAFLPIQPPPRPPCWFSLNSSETVKAIKNYNPDILQHSVTVDIVQNSDRGISDFRISGQSLINKNSLNSRTKNCIDMKLRPVTKLDKIKTATLTMAMLANCDAFPIQIQIFFQFMTN